MFYPLLYFLDSGGWFAALLPGVCLHELGHWAAVRLCRGRVLSLRLDLAGLCMTTTPFSSRADEIFCALAGPVGGLLWLVPAALLGGEWGDKSARAALLVNAFNLLPALPLDGGRVLLALTPCRGLVRCSTLLCALGLFLAAWRGARWLLLLPAMFFLRGVFTP